MAISIEKIKQLREKTGSGMVDCKNALIENDGDIEKAIVWLREKGIAAADKKSSRVTAEGVVDAYIHAGGRVGVLIEVNIETDFAAKNDDFQKMVRDIAMQVAAMKPQWVSRSDVPDDVIEAERAIIRTQALNEGKPEKIVEKIIDGRMSKFYQENCLLEQPFVKDDSKTIEILVKEMISRIGENITVRRFVRYELGEGLQKREENFAEEVMKQIK
jgi:elongation factor Ts